MLERRNVRRPPDYQAGAPRRLVSKPLKLSGAPPSGLPQAGASRHRSQPALVVGHHQAQGAADVDLLLPLRVLNVYRRYVVAWLVAERESGPPWPTT